MKSLATTAVMAGIVLGCISTVATAQQSGGLPDVAARVTLLESTVKNLQSVTDSLKTDLTNLMLSTAALQTALNAEIAARTAADSSLSQTLAQLQATQSALSSQLAAEQAARTALAGQLAAEQAARTAQYQQLNSIIQASQAQVFTSVPLATFLPNGDETTLARLDNLPSGLFLVSAMVTVTNFEEDAFWDCGLYYMDQFLMQKLETRTIGAGVINIDAPVQSLTIQTLASGNGSISFKCKSGKPKSGVENIKFFAVQLGS